MSNCFNPANILLPNDGIDMEKWSVIACDQFTADAGLRKNLLHRPPIYTKTQRLHVVGAAAQRNAADNDDDLWLCADGCTHHSDHLSIFLLAVLMHRPQYFYKAHSR